MNNYDTQEIAKFDSLANNWWNPQGEMKMLHQLNPVRLHFVQDHIELKNQKILDIGCGGGILSESLAQFGAETTGIDLSPNVIKIATNHAKQRNLKINYQCISAEEMALKYPGRFDVITCMELLEHVPNPASLIKTCSTLLKPGGVAFFSTLNRTLKSFLFAILGAEYLLNIFPRGTHHYGKLIRPSELTHWANSANLQLRDIKGINYQLLNGNFRLGAEVNVSYITYFQSITKANHF